MSGNGSSFHPDTPLGLVTLRVADLAGMIDFYSAGAGLDVIERTIDELEALDRVV